MYYFRLTFHDTAEKNVSYRNDKAFTEERQGWTVTDDGRSLKANWLRNLYQHTRLVWPILAVVSVGLAASKSANTADNVIRLLSVLFCSYYIKVIFKVIIDNVELGITIAFDLEIIWRFVAHLPDWRAFGGSPANWIDLGIAVASSLIQIPIIHDSEAYPWLTIFQLVRWYRVILEVPRMRPLILTVFGNSSGLMNMTLFLLIMNGLASLVAVQLLRGDLSDTTNMNFSQIWITFLAMYQVCSDLSVCYCCLTVLVVPDTFI